jgi:hypothetical protein
MNSAEQSTSSTVQEVNVVNIAVQYYESGPGFDEYSTTDAQNVAQMSIVIRAAAYVFGDKYGYV